MKKYALIVGVSRYDDPEIGNLNFAADDAREVGTCLREVCGFDEVRTLVTGGEREPDHISVVDALHGFAPILNPDDLFLFYFAGHGIHTANGSFLLASNSRIRMPELAAVPMPLLQQCLSRLDASERVLILDACRNDPHQGRGDSDNLLTQEFSRDILAVAKAPCEGVSPATCVLFSCSEGERAYEWPDKRHGAFTWYLLDGMRGAALDPQGRLTIQGLSRYVEEHVPRWSKKTGAPRPQTPWAQQVGSLREITIRTTLPSAAAVAQDHKRKTSKPIENERPKKQASSGGTVLRIAKLKRFGFLWLKQHMQVRIGSIEGFMSVVLDSKEQNWNSIVSARLSPDQKRLACEIVDKDGHKVVVVNADGSSINQVSRETWSLDGGTQRKGKVTNPTWVEDRQVRYSVCVDSEMEDAGEEIHDYEETRFCERVEISKVNAPIKWSVEGKPQFRYTIYKRQEKQ